MYIVKIRKPAWIDKQQMQDSGDGEKRLEMRSKKVIKGRKRSNVCINNTTVQQLPS